MKIIEENIFYSLLRNGKWSIHGPIWKHEGSALCYVDKEAEAYSWKESPIITNEFKKTVFEVVEIDISKLKVIYRNESKDLRKKRKYPNKKGKNEKI